MEVVLCYEVVYFHANLYLFFFFLTSWNSWEQTKPKQIKKQTADNTLE